MKLHDVLKKADLPTYEVEFILQELLGVSRHNLYEVDIPPGVYRSFLSLAEKRRQGFPLQYLLGVAYFYALKLKIVPGIFIPRPETEILVDEAIKRIKKGDSVLDVGSGSGAISLAIASKRKCLVDGIDISSLAIAISGENKRDLIEQGVLKGEVRFILGDFLSFGDSGRQRSYDVIVSNPPYIDFDRRDDLPEDVKKEPPVALFSANNGNFFYERLFGIACSLIKKEGYLLVELPGEEERTGQIDLLARQYAWKKVKVVKDLNSRDRVLVLKRNNKK